VHNQIVKGQWTDELIYAVLDHEWRAPKADGGFRRGG
jgi:hypothetical protein